MKIIEIIKETETLRDGQNLTVSEYINHINRLERQIYHDIISQHVGASEYKAHENVEEDVSVDDMYVMLYVHYLCGQIDLKHGDIARYNNSMAMHDELYKAYEDWYNRTYMPIQKGRIRWR
jgi:hypothetical protein